MCLKKLRTLSFYSCSCQSLLILVVSFDWWSLGLYSFTDRHGYFSLSSSSFCPLHLLTDWLWMLKLLLRNLCCPGHYLCKNLCVFFPLFSVAWGFTSFSFTWLAFLPSFPRLASLKDFPKFFSVEFTVEFTVEEVLAVGSSVSRQRNGNIQSIVDQKSEKNIRRRRKQHLLQVHFSLLLLSHFPPHSLVVTEWVSSEWMRGHF